MNTVQYVRSGRWRSLARMCVAAILALGAHAAAHAADEGLTLATAVYELADGEDAASRGTMTLTGGGRRERVRKTYTYRLDGGRDESWNLIRFTEPANIRGTGLLIHNTTQGASDQWLYLPALERVRRVGSDNRGGSFVQSELYYEDLEDRAPRKDRHRILREDTYEGTPVTVLESVPQDATNSVYSKRVRWVHEQTMIPLRVDFYEGSAEPVKRRTVQRIERIQGYWTVMDSVVTDLDSGRKTVLAVEEIVYDQDLPQDLFGRRALGDPAVARRYRP